MGFGVFLLTTIFAIFTVTHFLKTSPDMSPLQLAAELAMIFLTGLFLLAMVIVSRSLL